MVAMTDHEMTKACATAMGLKPYVVDGYEQRSGESGLYVLKPEWHVEKYFYYDPLTVDAQAMALVRRFHIDLSWSDTSVWHASWFADEYDGAWDDDKQAHAEHSDLNRAIVECVAKMQATVGDTLKAEKP